MHVCHEALAAVPETRQLLKGPGATQSQRKAPRKEQLFRVYHNQALSLRHLYFVYRFSSLNTSYIQKYIYSVFLFSSKPNCCSSPCISLGYTFQASKLGGVHTSQQKLRPAGARRAAPTTAARAQLLNTLTTGGNAAARGCSERTCSVPLQQFDGRHITLGRGSRAHRSIVLACGGWAVIRLSTVL